MDFLIGGLGLGAILAIAGFALRELTAGRPREPDNWVRPASLAMMLAAAIIWSITLAALLAGLDDSTALWVVVGGSLFAIAGSTAAGWAMRSGEGVPQVVHTNHTGGDSSLELAHRVEAPLLETAGAPIPTEVSPTANEIEEEQASDAVPASRESRDWEEIWRQTWGNTGQTATIASMPTLDPAPEIEPEGEYDNPDREAGDQESEREETSVSLHEDIPTSPDEEDAGAPVQPLEEVVKDRAEERNLEDESSNQPEDNRLAVPVPDISTSERDRSLMPPDRAD